MGMGEGDNKPSTVDLAQKSFQSQWSIAPWGETFAAPSVAQAQVDDMANDLLDKIPAWLKSVWDMENER